MTVQTADGTLTGRPREALAAGPVGHWSPIYRLKNLLLGPPLATSQLVQERLRKLVALPVFSSDTISSTAYGTEQIMLVLVAAGATATRLAFPIALAIGGLLAILILSYRQTIAAYPSAGGAYVVTRDNFGPRWAQLAGSALLIDYVLTVAVSVTSGVAALTTASSRCSGSSCRCRWPRSCSSCGPTFAGCASRAASSRCRPTCSSAPAR